MNKANYIIDFDRLNQLTAHVNDNPNGGVQGMFVYNISRKILRDYMERYMEYRESDSRLSEVIETLVYNKILITKADIRDNQVNQILNNK